VNPRFEINELKGKIESLVIEFPELLEDEILRVDMFEAETNINNVLSTLVDKVFEAETMQEAIAIRQRDLAARKARYGRQEETLRGFILSIMEMADVKSLKLPEATLSFSVQKPKIVISDEEQIEEKFILQIMTTKVDMDLIKQTYLETGEVAAGCSISNGKNILRISGK
jgi:hypothetical protein